jgi:hypothetical protein
VHNFFHYYENKDYDSINKRFGFSDNQQADALYTQLVQYPEELIFFKSQGGTP